MAAYLLLPISIHISSISITMGNTCIRKFSNRPLNGYHCNTEYYANVTTIPRHRCTELCIKDPQCWMLSYNSLTDCCLMASELCITAESNPHSSMMVFREKEVEPCVSWTSPTYNPAVPRRLVENRPRQPRPAAVARMVVGENIYIGHEDKLNAAGYFPIDGNEERETTNYEILSVSPSCSLAWVPYTTGTTVPAAALKIGYVTGKGLTYSIRVYTPDENLDKFGVYATGDNVAYYPLFGVLSATEVDILIQV